MFPHDVGTHIVEFMVKDKPMVMVTNKSTGKVITRDIEIWSPSFKYDYFMRYFVIDSEGNKYEYPCSPTNPPTHIIFTSYEGLFVWSMDLEIIYSRYVDPPMKYIDVYGIDIMKDEANVYILSWSQNQAIAMAEKNFPNEEYDKLCQEYFKMKGKPGSGKIKRQMCDMKSLGYVIYTSALNVDPTLILKEKII